MKFVAALTFFWLDAVLSLQTFDCETLPEQSGECRFGNIKVGPSSETLLTLNGSSSLIKTIKFHSTQFTSFPAKEFYERFDHLTRLDIDSSTGLTELKSLLFHRKLQIIRVENSDVESISSSSFKMLFALWSLSLSKNQIKTIDKNAFRDIAAVKYIFLESNQISWLHEDTFSHSSKLVKLNLSSNLITTIPAGLLSRNAHLSDLAVAHNKILSIEKGFTFTRKSFDNLDFQGNLCVDEKLIIKPAEIAYKMKKFFICFSNYGLMRYINETLEKAMSRNFADAEATGEVGMIINKMKKEENDVESFPEHESASETAYDYDDTLTSAAMSIAENSTDSTVKPESAEVFMELINREASKCLVISLVASLVTLSIVLIILSVFTWKILKVSSKQSQKFIATSASFESKV